MTRDYFFIAIDMLEGQNIFPFHLFVYSPIHKHYNLFLLANTPLNKEKAALLIYVLQQGGKLAISKSQKMTFLKHMDLRIEDVPELAPKPLHPLEAQREAKIKKYEQELKSPFDYKAYLHQAFKEDDFYSVIRRARIEISVMPLNISPTVSLTTVLAELLTTDTLSNRIVATTFFIAKIMNIEDLADLGDLIAASFIYHLGETFIPLPLLRTPAAKVEFNQYKIYQRHSLYSIHIVKKLDLDISKNCKKIIEYHHEKIDGSGYPDQISGTAINSLALVLGGISHIFEYSSNKYISTEITPYQTLLKMSQRENSNLFDIKFNEDFFEAISKVANYRSSSHEDSKAA